MLYKKFHRQYIRQFRVGRKFKWSPSNKCDVIIREPIIRRATIWVDGMDLIDFCSGKLRYKGLFLWLED